MDIKKGKKAFQWIIDVIAGEIFIRTTISLLGALLATSKLYMPYLSKWLVILDIPTALGAFGLFVGFSVIFFSVVSTPYWIIRAIRKKRKTTKSIKKLKRGDWAHQINLDIHEFRNILVLIKRLQSEPKNQKSKLRHLDNILEDIKGNFSQAEIVFENHELIDEKIRDLDRLFHGYRTSVYLLITKEDVGINTEFNIKKNLWGTPGDKNTLESQIMTVIKELISLLGREYRGDQE